MCVQASHLSCLCSRNRKRQETERPTERVTPSQVRLSDLVPSARSSAIPLKHSVRDCSRIRRVLEAFRVDYNDSCTSWILETGDRAFRITGPRCALPEFVGLIGEEHRLRKPTWVGFIEPGPMDELLIPDVVWNPRRTAVKRAHLDSTRPTPLRRHRLLSRK